MENAAKPGEYVAECFWSGVREADLDDLDARVRESVLAADAVRYLGSLLVPEDEVVFCFFDGPSAESVQAVAEQARIPFARILASTASSHLALSRRGEPE